MKITISSPDGLGDFVLRIPMIRVLLGDGHRLQMFMRRPALDLARKFFPGVEIHEITADPYHPKTRSEKNPFLKEHAAIRAFSPDLYVASLFALNFFDEVWFEENGWRVPVAGFSTADAFWPSGTIVDPARLAEGFHINVKVPVALPEREKNRRLASAILGCELELPAPSLDVDAASSLAAEEWLATNGVCAGEFWVACVGGRSGLQMKDWGEENWAQFLAAIDDGTPIVFFGNTKESESIERIRSSLSQSTINTAEAPLSLPLVLALAAKSRGYVGRDSGIMHLAAATGRRVFALFGGGHWGRFLPSGSGVIVTANVPCRGCDFLCPHERAHCIRDVSLSFAGEAWREFLQEPQELIVREESLAPGLLARIRATSSDELIAGRERASRAQRRSRQTWLMRMKTFFLTRIRPN